MNDALFTVRDRTALVTGGLGQLGRVFTAALAARGARVAVIDLAEAPGDDWPAATGDIGYFPGDVTNRASLERALLAIEARWGPPAILINNAGIDSPPDAPVDENGPFETYSEQSWDQVLDVNLKGVFLCCQVFGGSMARAAGGSIINISSIYGLVSPNQTIYSYRRTRGETFFKPVAYAASKSGLLNLTRYLSTYWSTSGVRVNTLTLAGVFSHQEEAFLRSYEPHVPLGRMARAEEYVGPMLFLASDASSYMTGANLVIDGGWTAW